MPDSAKAASLVSIRAAPPDPASHHLASFWSSPSLRRRYPCLTRVRPAVDAMIVAPHGRRQMSALSSLRIYE